MRIGSCDRWVRLAALFSVSVTLSGAWATSAAVVDSSRLRFTRVAYEYSTAPTTTSTTIVTIMSVAQTHLALSPVVAFRARSARAVVARAGRRAA